MALIIQPLTSSSIMILIIGTLKFRISIKQESQQQKYIKVGNTLIFKILSAFNLIIQKFHQMKTIPIQLNSQTNTIQNDNKQIKIIDSLKYQQIHDQNIVNFYNSPLLKTSKQIIIPVQFRVQSHSAIIFYHPFGEQIVKIPNYEFQNIIKQSFLLNLLQIYIQSASFLPAITIQNIYYLRFHSIKVLIIESVSTIHDFITNFKQVLQKIYAEDINIREKCSKIKSLKQLEEWYQELQNTDKEGKTIKEMIQLKNNLTKKVGPNIPLTQLQRSWIFQQMGLPIQQKVELIYNGIENYFDPSPLLKSVSKNLVYYLIQDSMGQRIAFLPNIKAQISFNSTFGTYFSDKHKKSIILNINKQAVYKLIDADYCVGYGPQILLCIGKLDFVFSAFNCSNVSYFPFSYSPQNQSVTCNDLFGKNFKLKQFEAYKIIK